MAKSRNAQEMRAKASFFIPRSPQAALLSWQRGAERTPEFNALLSPESRGALDPIPRAQNQGENAKQT